jgi:peptidoglycan/LPS O-acetylase OafA/YrhL
MIDEPRASASVGCVAQLRTFALLTGSRENNFDFLRLLFASTVIFTHSYNTLSDPRLEPLYRLSHGQMTAATVAVDFFFVISGFLIAASWARSRSAAQFARNRALRIYPGLIAVVFAVVLFFGPLGARDIRSYVSDPRTYTYPARQLLFHKDPCLYGTFEHSRTPSLPAGSLATLRYEVLCYGLVAAAGLAGLFNRRWLMLALFVGVLIVHNECRPEMWPVRLPYWGGLADLPRYLTYFLAGWVFYLFVDRIRYSRWLTLLCVLALGASLWRGLSLSLPTCGTYLLLYVAYASRLRLQRFGRYGDFSYGMYIYGYPVQQLLIERSGLALTPIRLTMVAIPLTAVLAVASWYLVESPFLRLKARKPKSPEAPVGSICVVSNAR